MLPKVKHQSIFNTENLSYNYYTLTSALYQYVPQSSKHMYIYIPDIYMPHYVHKQTCGALLPQF